MLKPVKKKPDQTIIDALEDILKAAKKGKLVNFALVGETNTELVLTAHNFTSGNLFQLLGALEACKAKLLSHIEDIESVE